MIDIMTHIHQYVPCYVHEEEHDIQGEMVKVAKESVYPILFGGDQLTASRARSAKKAKVNSVKSSARLEGLIPVAEDWHTKLNFLTVCSR